MIGRAISSKTSGGTGAGPGVNRYFFICGISNIQTGVRGDSQKKGWCPRLRIARPRFVPVLPDPVLTTWDNGADGQSQGYSLLATLSRPRCNGVAAIVKGDHVPMPIE